MEYIEFGKHKTKVSKVVLGLMRIPSLDNSKIAELLECALENGINIVDLADCYSKGVAESKFGEVLKDNPSLKDKFFIQSKCGIRIGEKFTYYDFSKDYILKCVDASLKRMQVDHLDSLLLHRPDALMEADEVAEAFNILKEQGKVINFGVSNMNSQQIEYLSCALDQEICANQVQLSICHTPMLDAQFNVNMSNNRAIMREGGILEYCKMKKIVVQAWSVMQYGFFEGVFIGSEKYSKLNEVLNRIACENAVTPTAVAIAFVLRIPNQMQAVIGTTNLNRVVESAKACDFKLTKEQWYELYLAAGNILP